MSKNDLIELTGVVQEVLPGSMYRIAVDNMPNILICYTSGRLKQHKIKILLTFHHHYLHLIHRCTLISSHPYHPD